MTTSNLKPLARSVSFDRDTMWIELLDGRKLGVPLAYFPRLAQASARDRKQLLISGGGRGLHWEELDEDISVAGLLAGRMDQSAKPEIKNKAA